MPSSADLCQRHVFLLPIYKPDLLDTISLYFYQSEGPIQEWRFRSDTTPTMVTLHTSIRRFHLYGAGSKLIYYIIQYTFIDLSLIPSFLFLSISCLMSNTHVHFKVLSYYYKILHVVPTLHRWFQLYMCGSKIMFT